MLLKTRKTWICTLASVCFMLLAALGAILCAPKTETAHAASSSSIPLTSTAGGVLASGTYHLESDLELSSTLTIPVESTASLDLRGHILRLAEGASGSVITVDGGTFTISDSAPNTEHEGMDIKGGVITGGNGDQHGFGGGVLIYFSYVGGIGSTITKDGEFTMYGGTIYGNTAKYGGGVCIKGGTFTMKNGTIAGNTASSGGGAYIDNGTFAMSGGTISDNTASGSGGGMYVSGRSEFTVSGAPIITGNKSGENANNVYIDSGTITVADDLTSGAKIGVNKSTGGEIATGFTQTTGAVTDFFVSDIPNRSCYYISDEATGTVKLDSHDFNSDTLICSHCKSKAAFAVWKDANKGGISYFPLYELAEKFSDTTDYYLNTVVLLSDVQISETLVLKYSSAKSGLFLLYLNGYKLEHTGTGAVIQTESNTRLQIHDAISTGKADADKLADLASKNAENTITYYTSDTDTATTKIKGGVITGGKAAGVRAKGLLTIYGGSISGNRGFDGGGVLVDGGELDLHSRGVISYNYAKQYGGGVRLDGGTVDLNGGTIGNNIAQHSAGGIDQKADLPSAVNIYSGSKISDNRAIDGSYGGLCVERNTTFKLSDGTISGNTAKENGGGIGIISTIPAQIDGGKICGNTATNGGGVYINKDYDTAPSVAMSNGTISGNNATYGGGVYVKSGAFAISGMPTINENKSGENANNVYLARGNTITVAAALNSGAQIYVNNTGAVATGFTQTDKKPSAFFFADDGKSHPCVYVDKNATAAGTVNIAAHTVVTDAAKDATCTETGLTAGSHCSACGHVFAAQQIVAAKGHTEGTAATCTTKAVCATCNQEYGDPLGHELDKLSVVRATDIYSAYDEFDISNAEVYTHCKRCDGKIKKLDASKITVTYSDDQSYFGKVGADAVTLKATVDGKELSAEYSVTVNRRIANVIWEYTTSPVSEENAWEWEEITGNSHFTYDGKNKNYRVRARFTGADNDPDKEKHYYRAADTAVLVYGANDKGITNVATYALSLDASVFDTYALVHNNVSIKVEPYTIDLSDADTYRWTLGAEQGSTLRDGYVKQENGVWLYYANDITGGEHVTRSVVRYRGENPGLSVMLNGGEIADLFAGTGKRTSIVYSGTTKVGAVGRYTAIATLELNDKANYKYTGEIAVAGDRGMTIEIAENGAKAVITKTWYVAAINNGLLNVDGGEYRINGWMFGQNVTVNTPVLENGDNGDISESDRRIAFELFTDAALTEKIGQTFYRYNFGDYINRSMPSGNYYLKTSVTGVADADGIVYQDFTRTFTFGVQKGELEVEDSLSGKAFEHEYNGRVQLFDDSAKPSVTKPKYLNNAERIGIWKSAEYDRYYGAAYMTYHLQRWHAAGDAEHEYVTLTQLNNTMGKKQAPREADRYTVYYRISALNYNSYGADNDKTFTVTIKKQTVDIPDDREVTYNGEEYSYIVSQNAVYSVRGNDAHTNADENGYDITLVLNDTDNCKWKGTDDSTVTVKLIIHKLKIAPPENVAEVLVREYTYTVPQGAAYAVYGDATFTQAGVHTVTLKLTDAGNCVWEEGDTVTGDTATITVTLTMHEHEYGEWTVDAEPTCTQAGGKHKQCALCGDRVEEGIAALGHVEVVDGAVLPTCTEKGKTEGSHCSRCDAVLTAQEEIAALGHDYGEWAVSKAATVDEFGEEKRVCAHDGAHTETRQTPKRVPQLVKPDENGGDNKAVVTTPDGFMPNIKLDVEEIARENYGDYEAIARSVNGEIGLVYDVTLRSDGVAVQPNGTLTIKLLIPAELRGKNFTVFHLHDGAATVAEYTVDGSYAVVTTDRLSEFIFVSEKAIEPAIEEPENNTVWIVLIVLMCVIIACEAAYVALRKTGKIKFGGDK